MGIFSKIKDAIFGRKAKANVPPSTSGFPGNASSPTGTPMQDIQTDDVDVEAILAAEAQSKGQDLNWRTSIVDLMKLLDIDSSLQNRKELAQELGYTGDLDGSAEMNMWLHKATMRELEKNGGRVPAEMID